jgi:hypothetical protein
VDGVLEDARLLEAISSDGRRVLEADLGEARPEDWVALARKRSAELLWLHTNADLAPCGFESFPGYVRLRTEKPPQAEPLPRLAPDQFARIQDGAFCGLWGHKLVAPGAEPPPGAVVIALCEGGEPVGLCTLFPGQRLVDGPGVLPSARDPAVYRRLLLGACAELGPGPVDVDSWGDDPGVIGAYESLGFAIVERVAGWQLRLD